MSLFGPLESFPGMFQCLSGKLVPGEVIALAVGRHGSAVRVCGELVHFGSSLVRVILHSVSFRSMAELPNVTNGGRLRRTRARVLDACCPAPHKMHQK